jgi:hypothetical protein
MPASELLAARIREQGDGRCRAALYLIASEHPAIAANAMDRTAAMPEPPQATTEGSTP